MIKLLEEQLRVVENRSLAIFSLFIALAHQLLVLRKCSQLIVEVITVKELLHRVSPQVVDVFFELGFFEVFPLLINVLLVEVVLHRRNEWRLQLLIVQIIPRKVTKPWVVLYFVRSVVTETILRLPLNHFVDEIRSFNGPSSWNFSLLNLHLF